MMPVRLVSLSMVLLLIAAICSGNAAESQANTGASSKITGNWTTPDCARALGAVTFTRRFYLTSSPDMLRLSPYRRAGAGADYLILDISGRPHAVTRTEDGVLRIGTADPAEMNGSRPFQTVTFITLDEFVHCPDPPEIIPPPILRLVPFLDRLAEACGQEQGGSEGNCSETLFALADQDENGRISALELQRAVVSLHFLSRLADGRPLEGQALRKEIENSAALAQEISRQSFAQMDQNGDGLIAKREADSANPLLPDSPQAAALGKRLSPLLPLLHKD